MTREEIKAILDDPHQTLYCAIGECESEAVTIIDRSNCPVCVHCAEVYGLGQANPNGTMTDLDDFLDGDA